jgi:hypothetical protein
MSPPLAVKVWNVIHGGEGTPRFTERVWSCQPMHGVEKADGERMDEGEGATGRSGGELVLAGGGEAMAAWRNSNAQASAASFRGGAIRPEHRPLPHAPCFLHVATASTVNSQRHSHLGRPCLRSVLRLRVRSHLEHLAAASRSPSLFTRRRPLCTRYPAAGEHRRPNQVYAKGRPKIPPPAPLVFSVSEGISHGNSVVHASLDVTRISALVCNNQG